MPELPEVETIRRGLNKQILNIKIEEVVIKKPNLVKQTEASFQQSLVNSSFKKIDRIGKLLIFQIDNKTKENNSQKYLLIHLKMTGQLVYCSDNNFVAGGHANSKEEEIQFMEGRAEEICKPGRFTHIIFKFTDNSRLFFNDMRQFGLLKVVNQVELEEIKSKYGIEPGQKNFTLENLEKVLTNRKANIKALLLNQSVISGLGNIYVDEALFASKIHPKRLANTITKKEMKELFSAIKRIIKEAIKNNGTTFSDFIDSEGKRGNFSQKLKVYGRHKEKCMKKNCLGTIQKIKIAGRGTSFCSECQKLIK